MDYEYSDLVAETKGWAQELMASAWASEHALTKLLEYDEHTPDSLFSDATSRPLIVAFLGGTGVGKSTLLNRLADKQIAQAGVVRPTSREVTLFHHTSVKIAHLPSLLPLDKIKIAEHSEAKNKHIIWIDMPDFDSAEPGNQQLVLEWLPHIDVLIYVVSPERYRDSKAWQILQAEGGRHAWIFVLNQSDRGQAEQYQDFIEQLSKAGFNNPLVYQTSCALDKTSAQPDEFERLQTSLQDLATENTITQLEFRGQQVRKEELVKVLQASIELLGPSNLSQELIGFWQQQGRELQKLLVEATILPQQQLAEYYALHSGDLVDKQTEPFLHQRLWDKWAQTRFDDALDALILQADQLALPVMPMKQLLHPIRVNAEKLVEEKTLLAVRKALINPGNLLQRLIIKTAQFAEIILPIAAMSWVGYQVFIEFYESSLEEVPHYVGANFAINSIMLIAIAWLFPYFLQKKLQPSIEKAALKGLKQGFISALQTMEFDVLEEIKVYAQAQDSLRQKAEVIADNCHQGGDRLIDVPENSVLRRMLL
ncbi:MAG TPA: GTP-binding protein [Methyloprofundus sp.]|uniref:GTPase n=1 Tax=Methyloprofundus sp. TaxID=2020875 RepID=UPI0017BBED96|nr:GTPase domain-containing protein [Methyloprofundus sp.]HIG65493.1 GTP-binding protein [Methyloprofundus sp.]HIL78703.1 GTP-binding protein [Methylococcales bacterium]